jgi:hypothetical protein
MAGSLQGAERIVPVILAATGPVRSVVDVGGGNGGWLQVFRKCGAEEVLLIDNPNVEPNLLIEKACFKGVDLNRSFPAPRRFDLAVCLECAEHLTPGRAKPLVEWLTRSADVVVFSAAIPGQGGKGHINERHPEYWRNLFQQRGFTRFDVLRPRIIHDQAIPWWYRQNLFLFSRSAARLSCCEGDFLPGEFHLIHSSIVNKLQHPGLLMLLRLVQGLLPNNWSRWYHSFRTSVRPRNGA